MFLHNLLVSVIRRVQSGHEVNSSKDQAFQQSRAAVCRISQRIFDVVPHILKFAYHSLKRSHINNIPRNHLIVDREACRLLDYYDDTEFDVNSPFMYTDPGVLQVALVRHACAIYQNAKLLIGRFQQVWDVRQEEIPLILLASDCLKKL